jgi:two-component system CheB/CheR fusion protein
MRPNTAGPRRWENAIMAAKKRPKKRATPKAAVPSAPPTTDLDVSAMDEEAKEEDRPGLPVVGIGASAGGLDAFKKFFTAMPSASGIAFVLIPHLDPKHESLMVELLSRHTRMRVVEAAEGMAVEANHVYILPPNKYMTIAHGVLRLTGPVERAGLQTSIDLFLRSLADDQQEKAICVILSGTGAHGSLGLKAVKAAGGMAMVQDPLTAEYARMPQNAIATGLADYVLPVEQMPNALLKYVQHFYVNGGKIAAEVVQSPDYLNQVMALLRVRTKFDFRCYRKKMLARRVERRMGLTHLQNMADYLAYLREHPDEVKHLGRDLLISVTCFFRDPEAFRTLDADVIAPLVEAKQMDASLRVWIPGCATGEEAYSIAMLLHERLGSAQKSCRLQVFATDVDEDALEVARRGIYPDSISTDVSPERLARFFMRADESTFQINKQVRESVVFAVQNLIADAPFSKVDLISCRNILIYLEPDVQKKVITLLHFSLNDGGYLLLGPSETVGRQTDLFEPVSKKWRIFRRIGPSRPDRVELPIANVAEISGSPRRPAGAGGARPMSFAELTQNLLLEELAPAAVLINRKYEILYFLGPTTRYLDVPSGEPTQDLLMMARDGLRTKLRGAVHKAIRDGQPVVLSDAQVKRNDGYHPITVTIKPVQNPKEAEGLLLVLFQDVAENAARFPAPEPTSEGFLVHQLEYELRATKEDLQSTIEEMESGNEELKASNEEVMSMNEELQSANEELETSKEELQSLNEELSTVNNQLQDKVEELEDANNDMANLLNCTEVAIIFLDDQFRIQRFTPCATRLFNLIPTDLDRPISDITPKFADNTLQQDVEQVLGSLSPREKQIETPDRCSWNRRITPYRTLDNRIEGVVLTFTDITQVLRADEQARRFAAVLRDSNDAVYVHDFDGKITAWNRGAEQLLGYSEAEALRMNEEQMIPEDLRAEARVQSEQLRRGERVVSWETQRKTKDGRIIDLWVTATALKDEMGQTIAIAKTERDITERKAAEVALRDQEECLRLAVVTGEMGTWDWDVATDTLTWNARNCELAGIPPQEFGGTAKHAFAAIYPEDRPPIEASITSALGSGMPFHTEFRVLHPDGSVHWLFGRAQPMKNPRGEVTRMIGVTFDITDRKHTEQALKQLNVSLEEQVTERTRALREREKSLQAILNTAADAIITINATGFIQSANPAAERMFGYAAAEMVGQNVKILMPSPYREQHDRYLDNYKKTGVKKIIDIGREVEAQRKDGSVFPVDLAVSAVDHLGLFTASFATLACASNWSARWSKLRLWNSIASARICTTIADRS